MTMKALLTAATTVMMFTGLGYAMSATLPDVHVSYDSRECVRVVNYTDEQFSCETLPAKFNHVWVL